MARSIKKLTENAWRFPSVYVLKLEKRELLQSWAFNDEELAAQSFRVDIFLCAEASYHVQNASYFLVLFLYLQKCDSI